MAAGPTIHIVDDDAAIRRSLQQLLHSAGFGSAVYETALGFLEAGDFSYHRVCRNPAWTGLHRDRVRH